METVYTIEEASAINKLAEDQLQDILTHPQSIKIHTKNGEFKYYTPDGRGVHLTSDGEFKSFLERKMENKQDFVIEISSDLDYEKLVANVLYKEELVAIISQELGVENLEIEIFPPFEQSKWKFSFLELIKAIMFAKHFLIQPDLCENNHCSN